MVSEVIGSVEVSDKSRMHGKPEKRKLFNANIKILERTKRAIYKRKHFGLPPLRKNSCDRAYFFTFLYSYRTILVKKPVMPLYGGREEIHTKFRSSLLVGCMGTPMPIPSPRT